MSLHTSTLKVAQEPSALVQPMSVWVYYSTKAETVGETSHAMFGRTLSDEVYIRLLDAKTGEIVRICTSHFEYAPGLFLPMIRIKLYRAIRVGVWSGIANVEYAIAHDGNRPQLLLLHLRVPHEAQKKGLATQMFAAHVHVARAFDFPFIHAYATGGSDSDAWDTRNGYYTWPRLGFDTRLAAAGKARLPLAWRHLTFLHEVMEQPGGREWWRKHGFALEVTFNTSPRSRSMQSLHAALYALKSKHVYWNSGPDMPLQIERGTSLHPTWNWQQRVWEYQKAKPDLRSLFEGKGKEMQSSWLEVSEHCRG